MKDFVEGDVVIVVTGQAGTLVNFSQDSWVLLANHDIWVGPKHNIRFPQDQADLDACIFNVERL